MMKDVDRVLDSILNCSFNPSLAPFISSKYFRILCFIYNVCSKRTSSGKNTAYDDAYSWIIRDICLLFNIVIKSLTSSK